MTCKPISPNLKQFLSQLSVLMGKLTFGHRATLSSRSRLTTVEPDFAIRISDLGSGQYFRMRYWCCTPLTGPTLASLAMAGTTTPVTPVALRAPEIILRKPWDVGIDVWSFGCLVCGACPSEPHMLTNYPWHRIGSLNFSLAPPCLLSAHGV